MTGDRGEAALTFAQKSVPAVLAHLRRFSTHHILYHADVDGACAAAMLGAGIREAVPGSEPTATWIPTSEFHFAKFLDEYPLKAGACYVSVDLNFSSKAGLLEQMDDAYGDSFVVIDDHVPNSHLDLRRILYINPNRSERDTTDLASTLYAYLLAKEAGLDPPEWMAVLGLYFDRQLHLFVSMFAGRPLSSEMDKVIRVLSADYLDDQRDHNRDPALRHLTDALKFQSSWTTFRQATGSDHELRALEEENEHEINRVALLAEKDAQIIGSYQGVDVTFVKFESRLQIANIIASRLRGKNGSGIYIAMRCHDRFCQFEARLGSDVSVNLVALLSSLSRSTPLANYGGHPRAAGGSIARIHDATFGRALKELIAG